MNEIIYLSIEQVETIHDYQLETYGGNPGIKDRGLLESAIEQPSIVTFGHEPHSTIELKAAAYLFHISNNHAFQDANKRTAVQSMVIFLEINGMCLDASDDELYDLVLQCVKSGLSKQSIAEWISAKIKLREPGEEDI